MLVIRIYIGNARAKGSIPKQKSLQRAQLWCPLKAFKSTPFLITGHLSLSVSNLETKIKRKISHMDYHLKGCAEGGF
jgi:hypothetical protein